MRLTRLMVAVAAVALLPACFHATVETGATPSTEVISKSFASGWFYGLVPPSTVETAAKCPNGVAKVETQRSFANQFVSLLTFGLYAPMSIKATCAAAGTADVPAPDRDVALEAGTAAVQEAFAKAAEWAAVHDMPVYVQVR